MLILEHLRVDICILKVQICLHLETRAFLVLVLAKTTNHCFGESLQGQTQRRNCEQGPVCLGTQLNRYVKTKKLPNISMNVITKEYLPSVKMNLRNRNNLSTNEHFQGSHPCGFFILLIYAIVCFVMIPMIANAVYLNKEDFDTQGNYFADE